MRELSIIIPFYKSEKYIKDCLDSILGEWKHEPEIICVNDNSPDNTAVIIEEYIKKYSFIKMIDVEGDGVSAARNTGLKYATGKYVCFIDSDDTVKSDALLRALSDCLEKNPDIYVFGGVTTVHDKEKIWMKACLNPKGNKMYTFKPEVLIRSRGSLPVTWNKFFKRSLLTENKIVFPEELSVAEDLVFQFDAFSSAGHIYFSGEKVYCYRIMVEESAMTYFAGAKLERAAQHMEAVRRIFALWGEKGLDMAPLKTWAVDFLYGTMVELDEENRQKLAAEIMEFFNEYGITEKDQHPDIHCFNIIEAYGVLGTEAGNDVYGRYRNPSGIFGKIRRKTDYMRRNIYLYGLDFALRNI